jgi:hypothetical protein
VLWVRVPPGLPIKKGFAISEAFLIGGLRADTKQLGFDKSAGLPIWTRGKAESREAGEGMSPRSVPPGLPFSVRPHHLLEARAKYSKLLLKRTAHRAKHDPNCFGFPGT